VEDTEGTPGVLPPIREHDALVPFVAEAAGALDLEAALGVSEWVGICVGWRRVSQSQPAGEAYAGDRAVGARALEELPSRRGHLLILALGTSMRREVRQRWVRG
jgi:hypothetical protein